MCRDLFQFNQKSKEYPEFTGTFFFVLNGNLQGQDGQPAFKGDAYGDLKYPDGWYFSLDCNNNEDTVGPFKTEQAAVNRFEDNVADIQMEKFHDKLHAASMAIVTDLKRSLAKHVAPGTEHNVAKFISAQTDDLWDFLMENLGK